MPEYRVLLARSAERELEDLPLQVRSRAVKAIDNLAKAARPAGIKKLQGSADLWRIRVGEYRVVYRIDDRERLVDVIHIRHRKDAYR